MLNFLTQQARKPIAQITGPRHAQRFSFQIFQAANLPTRHQNVRELNQRCRDQLDIDAGCQGGNRRIGGAVEKLNLVRHQRSQRRPAAADKNMLQLKTVFVEKLIFQCRIKMGKAAGDRAGSDANADGPLPGLCQIRIRRGGRGSSRQRKRDEDPKLEERYNSRRCAGTKFSAAK